MNRSAIVPAVSLAIAALLTSFVPGHSQARTVSARYPVLVLGLSPLEGADSDFGERVAEQLRDRIEGLPTHRAVSEDELEDALDRFKIDEDQLDCVKGRQLLSQIDARLVLCGEYAPVAGGGVNVSARFVDASGETFTVEEIQVGEDGHTAAAVQVLESFQAYVDHARFATFCREYYDSSIWDDALTNCDRALALNPEATAVRYLRARTLMSAERFEESLDELERVLVLDPTHQDALRAAGFVATTLGRTDAGRDFYALYLDLAPGDVMVRISIAYDMAKAGDVVGAVAFVEAGLELDPADLALEEHRGVLAFAAAERLLSAHDETPEPMPEEIEVLYGKAVASFERIHGIEGAEMDAGQLRNLVAAHLRMGDAVAAATAAELAVATHPGNALLWSSRADALQRSGDLSSALDALDVAAELDADLGNVAFRRGAWLLAADRREEAIPHLRTARESGERPSDEIARLLIADAHGKGVKKDRYDYALTGFEMANEFAEEPQTREMVDFWRGFSLYKRAEAVAITQTLEAAQATLPDFRLAQELFQGSREYTTRQGIDLEQLLRVTAQQIEIGEMIIKRGRDGS